MHNLGGVPDNPLAPRCYKNAAPQKGKNGTPRVAGAAAWQCSVKVAMDRSYTAPGVPDEPRGRNRRGISRKGKGRDFTGGSGRGNYAVTGVELAIYTSATEVLNRESPALPKAQRLKKVRTHMPRVNPKKQAC